MSPSNPAVFLSYARDDADAARRIAEALRSQGVEVWFDQNELRGGDAWDAKLRTQIRTCSIFMPVISATTQGRTEGYFRREWKLAVDRTHDMASGIPFLAPVVMDDTLESDAIVPDEFMRVQWMRLPGALPTPPFIAQVKALLEPRTRASDSSRQTLSGSASSQSFAPSTHENSKTDAKPASRRSRKIPIAIGAIAVAALVVAIVQWQRTPVAPTAAPAAKASAVPISEAKQLVAKARALYEPWDFATSEEFAVAEELLKRAVVLDPADGDAWAAYALLSCGMATSQGDTSPERRLAARSQAARAIALAPDSPAARFARAFSLRFNVETRDECVRLLREEAGRQPGNALLMRTLGGVLSSLREYEAALVYFEKAVAVTGADPTAQYMRAVTLSQMNRLSAAEAAVDEALATAPAYVRAHRLKITLLLDRGEVAEARAQLAKVPPAFLTNDYGALEAARVWLYSRDAGKCLQALRHVSDYPTAAGTDFLGPKAYLTGLVHTMEGNPESARTEWRAALQVVEQRLAADSNSSALLCWKATLLAAVGERKEAETMLPELRQRLRTGAQISDMNLARVLVWLGRQDETLEALESSRRRVGTWASQRNALRYDPVWDSLRKNPRFEALLRMPDAKK